MTKQDFNFDSIPAKELVGLKSAMGNMETALKGWGIKATMININPEKEVDIEKLTKDAIAKFAKGEKKNVTDLTESETKKIAKEVKAENKKDKNSGYWIIQGSHKSFTGETFKFQIVREHGVFKNDDETKPQFKIILQYGKDNCIENFPQSNPDLKAIIGNYLFTTTPKKLTLETVKEEKVEK